ncbi:MAG: hypothetical protein AB1510_00465 [Bacillota bacterium]
MAGEKENECQPEKIPRVLFKYPLSNRYYLLTDSSGYPSAEYQYPYVRQTGIVIREVDR